MLLLLTLTVAIYTECILQKSRLFDSLVKSIDLYGLVYPARV